VKTPLVFHLNVADSDCPGVIVPRLRNDDNADLVCAECGSVFATVRRADASEELLRLAAAPEAKP
jgi:hypothetical protein